MNCNMNYNMNLDLIAFPNDKRGGGKTTSFIIRLMSELQFNKKYKYICIYSEQNSEFIKNSFLDIGTGLGYKITRSFDELLFEENTFLKFCFDKQQTRGIKKVLNLKEEENKLRIPEYIIL